MKIFSVLAVFLLASLFSLAIADNSQALECSVFDGAACFDCCKDICDFANDQLDCSGTTGEDRKDCRTLNNIAAKCCYTECLEEECFSLPDTEAPEESVVCEALDELCDGDPD